MKTVDFNEFLEELEDVLAHPRPWAHIRFGDGEGIVMGYPEYTKVERCKARWHKWLGDNEIVTAPGYMTAFSELIRASVEIADIVGTPCLRHQYVNQDWRNVIKYMEDLGLVNEDTRSCCMDHTVDLQRKGLYRKLLQDKEIIYISCRKVTNELMAIGAKNVMGIFLPPQNKPFMGDVHTKKKHYTEIYNAIKGYIFTQDIKNKLFLVGAGGLGKIYCTWIKEMGGIALDIGSIFDGWAGLITRSYLKDIGKFKL